MDENLVTISSITRRPDKETCEGRANQVFIRSSIHRGTKGPFVRHTPIGSNRGGDKTRRRRGGGGGGGMHAKRPLGRLQHGGGRDARVRPILYEFSE